MGSFNAISISNNWAAYLHRVEKLA
jgi:hypothetical protein